MPKWTRRNFLKSAAAAFTTVGVMAAAPLWALKAAGHVAAATKAETERPGSDLSEPLVAYVRDAAKGEVVLMVGTREVVRKDPGLVSHLIRCCEV